MYAARISYFLVFVTLSSSKLTGDYVCQRMENYTVNRMETYKVPIDVNTMEWCLTPPFRCLRKKIKFKEHTRIKTELKTRIIDECCEGYARKENDAGEERCTAQCDKCEYGTCVAPNTCECNPGYQERDCSNECPDGFWGKYCLQECKCSLNGICRPADGICECLPGWQGSRCDEKCPQGKYGTNCEFICSCQNSATECNHVTGECDYSVEDLTSERSPTIGQLLNIILVSSSVQTTIKAETIITDFESNISTTTETPKVDISLSASKVSVGSSYEVPTTAKVHVDSAAQNNERNIPSLEGSGSKLSVMEKETLIPRVILSPESDFVKTIHKDETVHPVPIPVDVAVLIIIGSMISLSLTSVAALMIFHMRSRLIKAVRMSIYPTDKCDNQLADNDSVAPKSIHANTLPRTTSRMNSVVISTPEPKALLSMDNSTNEYANGTVTIDIRNLRDLLEGHYDRPTSSYQQRHGDHAEHVYDEIPLSTSLGINNKNA